MFTTHKKRSVIICFILACVLGIIGLFFVDKNKKNDIVVSAETTEATSKDASLIYFDNGASIETGSLDFAKISFTLNVHQDFFKDTDLNTLVIALDPDAFTAGIKLEEGGVGSTLLLDCAGLEFERSYFDFSSSDWAKIRIKVNASAAIFQDVCIHARLSEDGLSTNYATSSVRSWNYIYTTLLSNGSIANNGLADNINEFKTTATGLELSENAWLSSYTGLALLVNVPDDFWNYIDKGLYVESEKKSTTTMYGNEFTYVSSRRTVRYFLSIFKSTSAPNLGNKTYSKDAEIKKIENKVPFNTGFLGISHTQGSGYYYLGLVKECNDFWQSSPSVKEQGTATTYSVVEWSNAVEFNVPELALDILSDEDITLTENEALWLQDVAGVKPSTNNVTVWLKYKKLMQADDVSSLDSPLESFQIPRAYAFSKQLAIEYLYKLKDYSSISDFNVIYSGSYYENGYVYKTGKRIVLQAEGFDYSYSSEMQSGTLEVRYANFQYKDLAIKVKNNDSLNPLVMDVYTDKVNVGENETTLTYKYSDVQTWLLNSCQWLFQLTADNIVVNNSSDQVMVTKGTDALTVSFPNAQQSELLGLSLQAVAEITEDEECSVAYQYSKLNINDKGDIVEEKVTSDPFTLFYSELIGKYSTFENFMLDYGEEIRDAVVVPGLDGEYFIPSGLYLDRDDTGAYTIVVEYTYNTIFKITDNLTQGARYIALNKTTLSYKGNYFVKDIQSGYRVLKITTTSNQVDITNKENYLNSEIVVRTSVNKKLILPIRIEFTDKWTILIDYKETYKDTCFAVRKQFNGEIRLLDYPDVYALTVDDIQSILGKSTLDVCGMVSPDAKVNVSFNRDKSTYTATLTYGVASLKQIDYDGNSLEIQVPLTSYVDWCEQYGANWSILFLNTENKRYFTRSNEVDREDLYGFFSVAVFKEQVSDFNYYFKNNTGAGCMTIFNKKEVTGSGIYEWFGGLTGKGVLTSALGYIGMAFCEILNDNNQVLHSYFFYLDGSDANPYLSNGGASSAFDEDSATGNFMEDVGNTIGDLLEDLKNGWEESPWRKILLIVSGISLGLTIYLLYRWGKKKLGIKDKTRRRRKKKSKPKTATGKGQKVKETKK